MSVLLTLAEVIGLIWLAIAATVLALVAGWLVRDRLGRFDREHQRLRLEHYERIDRFARERR